MSILTRFPKMRFCLHMKETNKMKTKRRESVFETNSSSVHTIVVKYNGMYKLELERDDRNPFAVVGHCMDYSVVGHDEDYIISTQQDKFNYLVSWVVCSAKYGYDPLEESWGYKSLLYALQLVDPNIDTIIMKDEDKAGFDHQTAPYSYNDCVINMYDEHAICNFIFNDNITLKCNFD